MAAKDCAVCKNKTTKACGACKAVFSCSTSCQQAIWSTHKWTCGRPDGFSQAPLTATEANQLLKLHRMDDDGDLRPWCWHNMLKQAGLWAGPADTLLDSLQQRDSLVQRECTIDEPERSLILSDLRCNLFRAGCEYGMLPDFVVTPWVTVGRLHRAARRWGPQFSEQNGGWKRMNYLWSHTLHQYLILETLRALRAMSALPPGLPEDVEALALQRTQAAFERITLDPMLKGAEPLWHRSLEHCEETRTTTLGRRGYSYAANEAPPLCKILALFDAKYLDPDIELDVD
ncbi:hypothetical protein JCM3770_004206 [Rhodotorula araucariae]